MTALAFVHAAWADLVACTMIYAMGRMSRARPADGDPRSDARVLVVRPCAGVHPRLEAALTSTRHVRADVVFAVADETDPAAPVVAKVAAALDAPVVITRASKPNRKAEQVAAAVAGRAFDVLVVADDDVELEPDTIHRLLAPLADGRVAAAWATPAEIAPVTFGDRVSAAVLGASLHAFRALAALDSSVFVGKLLAVRADALARAGGFASLTSYLGEDTELARRLRAAGEGVVRADVVARSVASGRRLRDVVARYARWIAVVRSQRPWLLPAYPLLLAATPLVLVTCFGSALCAALAFSALVARLSLAAALGGDVALALVADVVLLAAFARALLSQRVVWRGVSLRVEGERARDDGEHTLRDARP